MVQRTQVFVTSVEAESADEALRAPIEKMWLDDPVDEEWETWTPDASERRRFAKAIEHELDDANF